MVATRQRECPGVKQNQTNQGARLGEVSMEYTENAVLAGVRGFPLGSQLRLAGAQAALGWKCNPRFEGWRLIYVEWARDVQNEHAGFRGRRNE